MIFRPIPDNAARQVVDSCAIWSEFLLAKASVKPYVGGMYWKKESAYEYLVRTLPGNKRERLGPRTRELEQYFQNFQVQKEAARDRLTALSGALYEAQRLNKALRVGRVPDSVVKLLNGFEELGLDETFVVVGTHALLAYELAAGVRIAADSSLLNPSDLLGDARRVVTFIVGNMLSASALVAKLQLIDGSYRLRDEGTASECIINNKGFVVTFIRVGQMDIHLQSVEGSYDSPISESILLSTFNRTFPICSQTVISSTGKMATMRVLTPKAFLEFSQLLAKQEEIIEDLRSRHLAQAQVVNQLLNTKMLLSTC
jgi:hypothetical protein